MRISFAVRSDIGACVHIATMPIFICLTRYSELDAFLLTRYYTPRIRNRAYKPLMRSHACTKDQTAILI